MEADIKRLRNRILEVAVRDGMGHIPSALSILDTIWILYSQVMLDNDQFILSKGHGVMALYAVLEEMGLINWSLKLMGHPKRDGAVLASTGSLGHGLPMAIGLAKAKKIKKEKGRVFCIIGDGECNEGTIWESTLLANHHKLDNLVVIVDQNKSSERALEMGSLTSKFQSFGLMSIEVDGHNHQDLSFWLKQNYKHPAAIICNTTKGHGVSYMENNPEWHNRKINA